MKQCKQKPNVTENNNGLNSLENSGQIFNSENTTFNREIQDKHPLVFSKAPTVCPCGEHKRFYKLANHPDGGKCWSCEKFFPPTKSHGSPKINKKEEESSNQSKNRAKSLLTLERIHTYWTNDGNNYLMQVRVFRDTEGRKSCFQYRWDGELIWDSDVLFREEGQWVRGLDNVHLTLYEAPLLLMLQNSSQDDKDKTIVFIVEGEKDCEALRKKGHIATCNPLGAGKWKSEFNELLRGLVCCVIPDNDAPGLKHVQQIEASLRGIAKSTFILYLTELMPDLPHKGDVSDYIELGGVL